MVNYNLRLYMGIGAISLAGALALSYIGNVFMHYQDGSQHRQSITRPVEKDNVYLSEPKDDSKKNSMSNSIDGIIEDDSEGVL